MTSCESGALYMVRGAWCVWGGERRVGSAEWRVASGEWRVMPAARSSPAPPSGAPSSSPLGTRRTPCSAACASWSCSSCRRCVA
eukprot:scaffold17330_cov42-Phaeocystis_antarctica.AAC.1